MFSAPLGKEGGKIQVKNENSVSEIKGGPIYE
jgi:hypothetical protein